MNCIIGKICNDCIFPYQKVHPNFGLKNFEKQNKNKNKLNLWKITVGHGN